MSSKKTIVAKNNKALRFNLSMEEMTDIIDTVYEAGKVNHLLGFKARVLQKLIALEKQKNKKLKNTK